MNESVVCVVCCVFECVFVGECGVCESGCVWVLLILCGFVCVMGLFFLLCV